MCAGSTSCSCGSEMPGGPQGRRGSIIRSGAGIPSVISTDLIWDKYIENNRKLWSFNGTTWVDTTITLGTDGEDGSSQFIYIGYATANDGTGYNATPSNARKYISIRQSTTAIIAVDVTTFTGPWVKYIGDNGTDGVDGKGYLATSTSSLAISVGVKNIATQLNLAYSPGARARLTSLSTPALFMEGVVTAYNASTGSMVVTIDNVFSNAGTKADWNINIAGQPGINGALGLTGPGYYATSAQTINITTTDAPGTSLVVVTQTGLAYSAGARVRISGNTTNYLEGVVTAYAGTNLTVDIDRKVGSGSFSSFNINIAGDVGAAGTNGTTTMATDSLLFKAKNTTDKTITAALLGSPAIGVDRVFFEEDTNLPFHDDGDNFDGFSFKAPEAIANMAFFVENFTIVVPDSGVSIQITKTSGGVDSVLIASGYLLPTTIAPNVYTEGDDVTTSLSTGAINLLSGDSVSIRLKVNTNTAGEREIVVKAGSRFYNKQL